MEEVKELQTLATTKGVYNSFPDKTAREQLGGKLSNPGGLKVGDYLRVQSVGADGTVVLEGAETPGGGSGQNVDQLTARKSGSVIVIPDARPMKFKGLTIPDGSDGYAIRLYGKNVFDMDTVLPNLENPSIPGVRWTKEADGSYSLFNVGVIGSNQPWWKNTSGYNGQISISFDARQDSTDLNIKTMSVKFDYTDGTSSGVECDCTSEFRRYAATSIVGKTVAQIRQSYIVNKKTYVKNIMVNYGGVAAYEPFISERSVIVSTGNTNAFTECEALAGYNTIVSDNNTDMVVEYVVDPMLYAANILADYEVRNTPDKLSYYNSRLPVIRLYGDTSAMTKDNAVEMAWKNAYKDDGAFGGGCTVKWQGNSSLQFPKKNYAIKFGRHMKAWDYAEKMVGWPEESKFCFKANWIDSSHLRNILCAKLWGKVVKSRSNPDARLVALPNGGAIDGFPCIVLINDEFAGLYTWNIPKDGWMMGMGDGTNECIVCANGDEEHLSCSFAATEQEFGQGFDLEYIADESNTGWALTSLNNLITAVMNGNESELDNLLDWDSAIDYTIFYLLTGHLDGYSKNYLLSTYDGTKWFFTAYDMDSTFGLHPDGSKFLSANELPMAQNLPTNPHGIFRLVTTTKKDVFKARYVELRSGVMSVDNVCTDIDNFARMFPADIYAEEYAKWQTPNSSINGSAQMKEWYRRRVAIVDAQIEAL